MADKPHFHGHRERLRKRFDEAGADALPDYELLELLLCQALPRRDVKPLAKKLIERFGTIGGVLGAEKSALKEVAGVGDGVVHTLKLVEALGVRTLREPIIGRPVIATWQAVLDYCTARLGKEKTEHFRVLYLDNHNALIADEEQQHGTVDHVVLYPREVIKRALEHGASAVVLVHNHPSGNPSPSRADIELTKEVAKAGATLGVTVHDHLVIGRSRHVSLKEAGLLQD